MQKVVEHGLKLDLHIHSYFSSAKDGKKVAKKHFRESPNFSRKAQRKRSKYLCNYRS